jgi:putative endonuclease
MVRFHRGSPPFARASRELRVAGHAFSFHRMAFPDSERQARVTGGVHRSSAARPAAKVDGPDYPDGQFLATRRDMPALQRFVYIIRSDKQPHRYYTGLTSHVKARLADHNNGHCRHTANATPWKLVLVVAFSDPKRALQFEKYLKSGSGCAFAARHFR